MKAGKVMKLSKSNIGLVQHCQMALADRWGYVYGMWGLILNTIILNQKRTQYPVEVGRYLNFIKKNWLGRRTVDCAGLIKSYLWWKDDGPLYDPGTDISADMMFERAKEKGIIEPILVRPINGIFET